MSFGLYSLTYELVTPSLAVVAALRGADQWVRPYMNRQHSVAERGKSLFGSGEPGSETLQVGDGRCAVIFFQGSTRILHDGHAPASFQQTFCGEADAVFRHHSEHHELSVIAQPLYELVCVPAF